MKVFDAIRSRRSVRDFKDKDIPRTVIAKLVEAFRLAPSAGNIHYAYTIVVQNPKVRKKIADACTDQEWVGDASAIIVVCSKTSEVEKVYGERGKMYALQGTAAATQNVLLTAEELGVNGTWIGAFSESKIKKVLKIPQVVQIHNLIALGYAKRIPKAPSRPPAHITTKFDSWMSQVKGHKDLLEFWEPDAKIIGRKISKKVNELKKKISKIKK